MKNNKMESVQIRVYGPEAEWLQEVSESTGFSVAHVADTLLTVCRQKVTSDPAFEGFRKWVAKSSQCWQEAKAEEARAVKRRMELDKLEASMREGEK